MCHIPLTPTPPRGFDTPARRLVFAIVLLAVIAITFDYSAVAMAQDGGGQPTTEDADEGHAERLRERRLTTANESMTFEDPAAGPVINDELLRKMTREELEAAGFVFEDTSEAQSRASATMLAMSAGIFVPGIGHWLIDDKRTAILLFGLRGTGLALIGAGLLSYSSVPTGEQPSPLIAPALFAGTSLIVLTYFMDVLGVAYSDDLGMPANSRRTRGLALDLRYAYTNPNDVELRHLITGELSLDGGSGYGMVRSSQDIQAGLSAYGSTLGFRPWRSHRRLTFVFVEAAGDYLKIDTGDIDFQRVDVGGRLGGSFDMGQFSTHLDHFAVGLAFGYGARVYGLDREDEQETRWLRPRGMIPLEIFAHFNATNDLNVRASYVRYLGRILHTDHRTIGVAGLEFTYQSTNSLDLTLKAEYGSGFALSGGLTVWMWE